MKEKMKTKYLVLEWEEIKEHLSKGQMENLELILETLDSKRNVNEKTYDYVVVSMDDPYVNEVIEVMKKNNDWH